MNKKCFYLENLGCAKNQVDAEIMINTLVENGWVLESSPDKAMVIIINTCGFIKAAKEESIDISLGFRAQYPGKKLLWPAALPSGTGMN